MFQSSRNKHENQQTGTANALNRYATSIYVSRMLDHGRQTVL